MTTSFSTGENPLRATKLNQAFDERVNRAGDSMTGPLVLPADPTLSLQAATKHYVDTVLLTYAQLPVGLQSIPLGFMLPGKPTSGQVYNLSVPSAVTIPAALAGTTVYATALATGSAVFTVNKITAGNVISALGTVTITTTNHFSKTLAGTGGTLAAGDVLQLVAPTQDATLSDIGITILATRV